MKQVMILSRMSNIHLEDEVNTKLNLLDAEYKKVIDIKISSSDNFTTVLIIYEDES